MNNILSVAGAGVINPLIKQYRKPGIFRDAIKQLLTGDINQVCPCWVLHGKNRSCSAVINKIADRKPNKIFMAIKIQRERCKSQAATIMSNPTLMDRYKEEKRKNRTRRKDRQWRNLNHTQDCFLIGDCFISPWRSKKQVDICDDIGDCDMIDCDISGCN